MNLVKQIFRADNLSNLITSVGLFCGLFVIFKINMVIPGYSTYEIVFLSTLIILVAAFSDLMDGTIAKSLGKASPFGALLDSISDSISFGVAPSALVLKSLSVTCNTFLSFLIASSAITYNICAVVRLANFTSKYINSKGKRSFFQGLPITAASIGIISLNLLLFSTSILNSFENGYEIRVLILFGAFIFLGVIMVSSITFPSASYLRKMIPSIYYVLPILALLSYLFFFHFTITLAAIAWGYILIPMFIKYDY